MPMIQTINLTKRYGELTALANLNLEIEKGDCFGFIGPNGAGKTTTIKILATLLKPTWGEARIDGLSVGPVNARQVRSVVGYVPDYFGSYPDMVVTEYLGFFAAAYDIHGSKRKRVVDDVLNLTDLGYKADAEVNSLSRGMQQRLSIARVLLHDPKVLLLDEPASGLDPRARIEIRELLKELHTMGKTILISSHILKEMEDLCNKLGVIERGQMQFVGTVQEIMHRTRAGRVVVVAVSRDTEKAVELVNTLPHIDETKIANGTILVSLNPKAPDPGFISRALVQGGFNLTRLEEERISLEMAFMRLTKGLVQ